MKGLTIKQIIRNNGYDGILFYDGWKKMERKVRKDQPINVADSIFAWLKVHLEYKDSLSNDY
jgi:hypothetical protein